MDPILAGNLLVTLIQAIAQLAKQVGKTPEEITAMLVESYRELETHDPEDLPEG